MRAVPAADWEHRVTLRAGVHLLFSDWVGGVRDVVLVGHLGLAVLEDADLRKLSMRLKFVLEMERHYIHKMKTQVIDPKITRKSHFELPYTNDLISKAKIWEKIEKKQEERRKKAELEEERRNIKDLIDGQTKTLSDMKTSPDTVFSDMSDIKSKLKSLEEMMTKMKSTIDQNQSKG